MLTHVRPGRGAGNHRANPWKTCFPLLAALFLLLALTLPDLASASRTPRVLVINSYNHGFKWTDDIVDGITSAFGGDADLRIEYMDARRISSSAYLDRLYESFRIKFTGQRFDVVIVSDDPALDLALDRRDELFPGVPVVFCGINNFTDARLRGQPLYTGVVEDVDPTGTIDLAITLHPGVRKVIVPLNSNATGIANRAILERIIPRYKGILDFQIVQDPVLPSFLAGLKSLPVEEYMILLTGRFQDREGMEIPVSESTPLIAESGIPLYSMWEFYLGQGIIGGVLTNGEYQGRTAAALARRVLEGEKNVPVVRTSPNEYMFDFRQLERHHVDQRMLPAGARIVNRPPTFYELHRKTILVALILTVSYSTIILILWRTIRQKKKAEETILAHERDLASKVEEQTQELYNLLRQEQTILETLPTGLCILEYRTIVRCNPTMEDIFGFARDTLAGRSVRCLYESDERFEEYGIKIYAEIERKGYFEEMIRYVRQNGEPFWAMVRGKNIFPGRIREHVIFSLTDITEQKKRQEELNAKNMELEEALARVKTLEGIISICMYCKKIRNEEQSWDQLESYISRNTDAQFSHGICPDCYKKVVEELD